MKRTLLLTFLAASILAGALSSFARSRGSFEEDIAHLEAGASCPLNEEVLRHAAPDVVAVCAKYGDVAFRIAERYPKIAPRLFTLYGDLPQWKEILDLYGHEVIPVVWYFQQGSKEIQVRQALGRAVEDLLHGERPGFQIEDLTQEQLGYVAILMLKDQGHDLLGQFEFVNGEVRRRPLQSALSTLKEIFLGGVSQLERVLVRGERWPSFGEIGSAVLDVAVATGGVSALASLRVAAPAAEDLAATRVGRLAALEVGSEAVGNSAMTLGRKILPTAAVAGALYLALTHPHVVTAAGEWIAERAGLPLWVGAFVVWMILVLPIAVLILPLVLVAKIAMRGFGFAQDDHKIRVDGRSPIVLSPVARPNHEPRIKT
jgi:hypothetical protein